jgi:hypothetical protein
MAVRPFSLQKSRKRAGETDLAKRMELRGAIDAFCFRPGETDGDRLMRISDFSAQHRGAISEHFSVQEFIDLVKDSPPMEAQLSEAIVKSTAAAQRPGGRRGRAPNLFPLLNQASAVLYCAT